MSLDKSLVEVRKPGWVALALWAAAGAWVWTVCVWLSLELAQGVAATPQPNQAMWVAISEWLPAVPVGAAILRGLITLRKSRLRLPAALAAARAFLWFSVAVLILAIPKAP